MSRWRGKETSEEQEMYNPTHYPLSRLVRSFIALWFSAWIGW